MADPSAGELVTAGALTGQLSGGALSDVRLRGQIALDAVYVAVRDRYWNTVPGVAGDFRCVRSGDGLTATWSCVHQGSGLDFRWHGRVDAGPDGITFHLDGTAQAAFETNRIGLCLLHPAELAGTPVQVALPDGRQSAAAFPARISPGPVVSGVTGLAYPVGPDAALAIGFEGGLLETEDHRNWTDPGWKTYTPPLAEPAPRRMRLGDRITQVLTLRATAGTAQAPLPPASEPVTLHLGPAVGVMPDLGIMLGAGGARDRENLSRLAPGLLHAELTEDDWPERLPLAASLARAIGARLSVALVSPGVSPVPSPGTGTGWLAPCARALAGLAQPLAAVAVFAPPDGIAAPGLAAIVRRPLAAGRGHERTPVGGGSLLHFAELNRAAPRDPDWDFLAFPVTPQVHHNDDASVMSTIRGQETAVRDASELAGGRPVLVGPVSLRPRTGPFDPARPDDPPDLREAQPIGAAWLAASVIAMHTARQITFLDPLAGLARAAGPAAPDDHGTGRLFATLAGYAGRPVHPVGRDRRLVAALGIARSGAPPLVLVSNLTPQPVTVRHGGRDWPLRGYQVTTLGD
jgi:hypothetical protein